MASGPMSAPVGMTVTFVAKLDPPLTGQSGYVILYESTVEVARYTTSDQEDGSHLYSWTASVAGHHSFFVQFVAHDQYAGAWSNTADITIISS